MIKSWTERIGESAAYDWDTAHAPGWKAMGYGGCWGITDPVPIECECGEQQLPLLTAASGEFDGGTVSWRPLEEADAGWKYSDPVGVIIGRGYTLQLYYCPVSELHTPRTVMF
ncbi:hypothetical protein OHB12_17970 [Nocardia sp. NBC_01730]|uniref:hypothetical protein n=1 Tax=Nocardia sp. NBC_01730 TaxID=2975998 RepID=UPI002E0D77FB|nr:hypothetical protein OHB12_17970 [Nocardia sp. NBC_01730]